MQPGNTFAANIESPAGDTIFVVLSEVEGQQVSSCELWLISQDLNGNM